MKEFKEICSLKFKEAIEAIQYTQFVYYKHGVWNSYEMKDTASVIKSIKNSGYGADVRYEKNEDMYYVSIPSDGDMF